MTEPPGMQGAVGAQDQIAQLRRENAFLSERVGGLALLQNELAAARHQLDQMTRRFGRMQSFMRRAVQTGTRKELARLACEGAVDILDCEIGMVWCLRCDQDHDSLYVLPGHKVGPAARDEMLRWAARWREESATGNKPPPPAALGLRDVLVEPIIDDDDALTGILIAANSHDKGDFHDPFDESAVRAFATFAEQVGAIMESRRRREMILAQIERIRVSEERLSLALEGSEVGLWDWDFESGRVFYSEQWKQQLGHTGDEISDRLQEWSDRLHPDDREAAMGQGFEFYRSDCSTYESRFRLRHRDGGWRWIAAKGFIVRDAEGRPRRAVGTHIDITDYKELEEKLRAAKDQAERASRAKSEFLAKVSHEIRTPLNGMVGTFQLLKGSPLGSEQGKLVALGESSGRWMMEVIGESLDLARIEAGKLELNLAPFDPRHLLAELMPIKSDKAAAKGLRFHWNVDPAVPESLKGDALRVRQIITNLTGNAIKFTEQGAVTVKLDMARRRHGSQRALVISVTDTGPGIPRELADTIFQPFEQLPSGVKRRTEGIGLGLSITRELVTLMGGSIRIRSRLGKGSRFEVRLPLEASAARLFPTTMPANPPARFRGRVLLVEDDPISRELAAIMLRRQGLEVETAENGREGLDRLLAEDFELAVVDCWMPELDGLEMTRRLRQQGGGGRQNLPIIALTANTQRSDISACHNAGMDYYLSKPLLEESLRLCLDRFLPRGRDKDLLSRLPADTPNHPIPRMSHPSPGK